jgi:hypothetical protein
MFVKWGVLTAFDLGRAADIAGGDGVAVCALEVISHALAEDSCDGRRSKLLVLAKPQRTLLRLTF